MSVKRFAIPSMPLRRGWSAAPDHARIVEARIITREDYIAAQSELGCIYFIGEQLGGDTIKIGWSRGPLSRMRQLQVGNPSSLKIISCVAANRLIEPALHQLFAASAVSGEWFTDPENSIRRWLNEMTFGQPIDRCRWFMAGSQSVTWHWDETAQTHRAIFPESQ